MGNVGGNFEFHKHVHETAVDSWTGEGVPGASVHVPASYGLHRSVWKRCVSRTGSTLGE